MLVGAISDTHLTEITNDFRSLVEERLAQCELLLHAGDFTHPRIYEYLKNIMGDRLQAVCGNMDHPALRTKLPQKAVFTLEGAKIGLIHGWGAPADLEERLIGLFSAEGIDCIVYGHSHRSANHKVGNVLLFNPGSPTDRYFASERGLGYLHIEAGRLVGEIINL